MSQTAQMQIFDPTQDKTIPTPVRVASVFYYMEKEPAIKEKFSAELVGVKKRSGEIAKFPIQVLEVAKRLHAEGKDALEIGKADILIMARQVLGLESSASPSKPTTTSEKGSKMVQQTIHGMLKLSASMISKQKTGITRDEVLVDIERLMQDLGMSGSVEYTPVIPYSLILSASQMAQIDTATAKKATGFDGIIKKLQRMTAEV